MNISGKCNVFVREVGEKKIKIFETSFSHKNTDGAYIDNVSVRVDFSKDFLPDEKKAAFKVGYMYPIEILEGFITTRGYDARDGKRIKEVSLQVGRARTCGAPVEIKKPEKADDATDDGSIMGPDGEPLPF